MKFLSNIFSNLNKCESFIRYNYYSKNKYLGLAEDEAKFREDGFNYIKIKNVYIVFFIVIILYLISRTF